MLLKFYNFLHMQMFCLHVCLCTIHVSSVFRAQKRVLDPLELKLPMVVSCHVGPGNLIHLVLPEPSEAPILGNL